MIPTLVLWLENCEGRSLRFESVWIRVRKSDVCSFGLWTRKEKVKKKSRRSSASWPPTTHSNSNSNSREMVKATSSDTEKKAAPHSPSAEKQVEAAAKKADKNKWVQCRIESIEMIRLVRMRRKIRSEDGENIQALISGSCLSLSACHPARLNLFQSDFNSFECGFRYVIIKPRSCPNQTP